MIEAESEVTLLKLKNQMDDLKTQLNELQVTAEKQGKALDSLTDSQTAIGKDVKELHRQLDMLQGSNQQWTPENQDLLAALKATAKKIQDRLEAQALAAKAIDDETADVNATPPPSVPLVTPGSPESQPQPPATPPPNVDGGSVPQDTPAT